MMRNGLQITLCLALIAQASILSACQQTQGNTAQSQARPADLMGRSGNLPPMVRPDQFGRGQQAEPRRITNNQQSRFGAQQIPKSQLTTRQSNDSKTITFSDQRQPNNARNNQVQQVSYTQDGVPVPSILGSQKPAPSTAAKTPVGQTPAVTAESIEVPKVASAPPKMQEPAKAVGLPNVPTMAQPKLSGGAFSNPIRSNGTSQSSTAQIGTQRPANTEFRTAQPPKIIDSPIADKSSQEAKRVPAKMMTMQQPTLNKTPERMASNFRTVDISGNSVSQIRTEGPKLQVSASGPSSIGIGKPARYEILVHNSDDTTANDLIVGVDVPAWIEIKNINTTQGTREVTDGSQESRLIWNVKQIAAGTSEKLIIDVVPKESKMFDLNVEWTVMPITGTASVQVTEPRLDIEISGPNEVQFGENALYSVTVSNPGTGSADNVSVMLPEALGGERAPLGDIQAGHKKQIQVELVARQSGTIELATTATADGDLRQTDSRNVIVRRGELDVQVGGPQMKYAGSVATYKVMVSNIGDAIAQDVVAAIALPSGVDYVSGIEAVEKVQGGIRWKVGTLSPNTEQTFHINCQLNRAGQMNIEIASRAKGDLATTGTIMTTVEAIADLVLSVEDPKGPLPTGQDVTYLIKVKNRGSKTARQVEMVMQFAEGIEPTNAQGHQYELVTGQVLFSPINQIEPGQEITLKVTAKATQEGMHVYRAQLLCEEYGREVAEGTTKFYTGNGNSNSELRTGRTPDSFNSGTFRK